VLCKSNTLERLSNTVVKTRYYAQRTKSRLYISVELKCFEGSTNWNAHYITDWSAERATNGVVDGVLLINMLPKDHTYILQCLQYIYMLYEIKYHMYAIDTHIYVVKYICCTSNMFCITEYVVGHDILFSRRCSFTEYLL